MAYSKVGQFGSRLEAELAAEVLAENGIPATVVSDDAGGTIPSLQSSEGASLKVESDHVARASAILRDSAPTQQSSKPALTRGQRFQSIAGLILYGLFVVSLVVYAALNMPPPS